jgi:hypothetical protein
MYVNKLGLGIDDWGYLSFILEDFLRMVFFIDFSKDSREEFYEEYFERNSKDFASLMKCIQGMFSPYILGSFIRNEFCLLFKKYTKSLDIFNFSQNHIYCMDLFKAFIDIINKHCIDTTVVNNLKLNMVKFYYENKVNNDVRLNGFYNRVILMETITYISNDTNDISKTDSNDAIAISEDVIATVDDASNILSEDDDIPGGASISMFYIGSYSIKVSILRLSLRHSTFIAKLYKDKKTSLTCHIINRVTPEFELVLNCLDIYKYNFKLGTSWYICEVILLFTFHNHVNILVILLSAFIIWIIIMLYIRSIS